VAQPTRHEIAALIERFIGDAPAEPGDEVGWDDFTSIRLRDPFLEGIRLEVGEVQDRFPAEGRYCNDDGVARLREIVVLLRADRTDPARG
jgi:hypothetical protein